MKERARPVAFVAPRAADRLEPLLAHLAAAGAAERALLLGPSREVADEIARKVARASFRAPGDGGARFGLERSTLARLALDLAQPALGRRGLVLGDATAREALVRRAIAFALATRALRTGSPAADLATRAPSYPRALAATLDELRLADVPSDALRARAATLASGEVASGEPGGASASDESRASDGSGASGALSDLAVLHDRYVTELERAGVADRALVLAEATASLERGEAAVPRLALVDVSVASLAEERFLAALLRAAPEAVLAVPAADEAALDLLARLDVEIRPVHRARPGALSAVQRDLFATSPRGGADDGSLVWLGAPGETREAVEVARRVLLAAQAGVPFDSIAVVVRSREVHGAAIESALARARIPAWFEAGTRRPHPAGRAFLALLACRREGLSARRFAEFLSLGEAPPAPSSSRWERLLREAAVIGGRDRWERRLEGLAREKGAAIASLQRSDPGSGRIASLERDLASLEALRGFAGPLVAQLAELPAEAPFATWGTALEGIARTALREPQPVLDTLESWRALGGELPARFLDVEATLDPLLRWAERPRPTRRHGKVLVTTPEGMRGRSVRVVLLPGLAERLFPPPVREDPLLPDDDREAIAPALARRRERGARERLRLALAVGAAEETLVVSYPRAESDTGRPRVPSLYALEILRARDGVLPELSLLTREAAVAAGGRAAWPAPARAEDAIDEAEHDLAVLGALLDPDRQEPAAGRARYLLQENEHLQRALRARFSRWEHRHLGPWDGARIESPRGRALLAAARLTARAHSPSSLQHFAACPYRFFLRSVIGLRDVPEPEAIERLDPLSRGELHHRALSELASALEQRGWSPPSEEQLGDARRLARQVTEAVGAAARDEFAPRVPRVFDDEIEELAVDVEAWLAFSIRERPWVPHRFDLSFGLPEGDHCDPRSHPEPARVGPFLLRGAIDAVERHAITGELTVTDFKTGAPDLRRGLVVGGGEVLQPVLYALALEAHAAALQTPGRVLQSRLLFASSRGGFQDRTVTFDDRARKAGMEVLDTIDVALDRGVLPALPREKACGSCGFRALCGPEEERRLLSKGDRRDADVHRELDRLRRMP